MPSTSSKPHSHKIPFYHNRSAETTNVGLGHCRCASVKKYNKNMIGTKAKENFWPFKHFSQSWSAKELVFFYNITTLALMMPQKENLTVF